MIKSIVCILLIPDWWWLNQNCLANDISFPSFSFDDAWINDKYHWSLLTALTNGEYPEGDYLDICKKYNADELDNDHELQLQKDYGEVFFLKNFPFYTSPFWNMKADFTTQNSNKIDVILAGQEKLFGTKVKLVDLFKK